MWQILGEILDKLWRKLQLCWRFETEVLFTPLSCKYIGWLVFDPRLVSMSFVENKVELGQIFLPLFRFSPVIIIPAKPRTHISLIFYQLFMILVVDKIIKYNFSLHRKVIV
jgi:hypothetical protein